MKSINLNKAHIGNTSLINHRAKARMNITGGAAPNNGVNNDYRDDYKENNTVQDGSRKSFRFYNHPTT